MTILIVRNSETAPEGDFAAWLTARGHAIDVVAGDAVTAERMRDAPLVIMFGSPRGVYETDVPWIAAQRVMVADRLAAQRPTIGICFGAQMMAAAAGGSVRRHPDGVFHRGWLGIDDTREPILRGPWPRWHGDVITPPPQAEVIARDAGTVQAFQLPNAIAVQFHPEATPGIIHGWAARAPDGAVDREALDVESHRLFGERRDARERLFAELLRRAGA